MSALCAFSAIAFASCSDSAEVGVTPTENTQDVSPETGVKDNAISNTLYAENNSSVEIADDDVTLSDIFLKEKIDSMTVSLSIVSSYLLEVTEEEDINTVVGELKDIELTACDDTWKDYIGGIDAISIDFFRMSGDYRIMLYMVCVNEDGTVAVTDGNCEPKYFSAEGAADYKALKEYFKSKGAIGR